MVIYNVVEIANIPSKFIQERKYTLQNMDYTEKKIHIRQFMTMHSVTFQTQLPLVSANIIATANPSPQLDAFVQEIGGITVASLDALVWNKNESWVTFPSYV